MATRYDGLTEAQLQEVYNVPFKVMGAFTSPQNCTFAIRGIKAGMDADLAPEAVGVKAYDEVAGLAIGPFDDIERGSLRDLAKFMQASVQTKLEGFLEAIEG